MHRTGHRRRHPRRDAEPGRRRRGRPVRHAQRLTGVPRLHALLGGLHLGGAFFTPSIGPTVHALTELAPDLLVPGHCTGWRAQHTLAAALPDSWVQGSSGTRYQLTSSLPAR